MKKEIVLASGNNNKLVEFRSILSDFKVVSSKEFFIPFFIEEDQDTFEGNAFKKAKTLADYLKRPCIADDTGLCIEEFDGWPGVKTARWRRGTDRERNEAILEKMKDLPKEERKARFVTAIAYSDDIRTVVMTHEISGYISNEIRGENGFGFDGIFELEDGRTLAELSSEEKNSMSSRRECIEKIKPYINY